MTSIHYRKTNVDSVRLMTWNCRNSLRLWARVLLQNNRSFVPSGQTEQRSLNISLQEHTRLYHTSSIQTCMDSREAVLSLERGDKGSMQRPWECPSVDIATSCTSLFIVGPKQQQQTKTSEYNNFAETNALSNKIPRYKKNISSTFVWPHRANSFFESSFRSSPISSNFSINQNSQYENKQEDNLGTTRQEVVSITYEEIGLFPRSFSRVFDRFLKQIFSDVENLVIQEYRFYRYLFLTTLKCLLILFIVPFLVNLVAKNYLIRPLTEYFWNTKQTEIFLNSYQQKRAFAELKEFEEKFYFSSLIEHKNKKNLTYTSSLNFHSDQPLEPNQSYVPTDRNEKTRVLLQSNRSFVPSGQTEQREVDEKLKLSAVLSQIRDKNVSTKPKDDEVSRAKKEDEGVREAHRFQASDATHQVGVSSSSQHRELPIREDVSIVDKPRALNSMTNDIILREAHRQAQVSSTSMTMPEQVLVSTQVNSVVKLIDSVGSDGRSPKGLSVAPTVDLRVQATFEYLLQEKTREIGEKYNNQSIENITSFFADLLSLLTLFYLLYALEIQINITKSFLLEVFFGLDDSKKSLLILLVTDLLVGYHSSNLWELFFELIFNHYGLPESQTGIFLLVATLPVLLDVLFKYLIFRHLNRSSPATVATYRAMIE